VLAAGGSSLDKVFKVTIFLADMGFFAEMNAEYAKWFVWEGKMPARSCVAVKQLPKGARVEIECIAQG
jgi:2-iminobutanoate/2-iminopropanoate deaminase